MNGPVYIARPSFAAGELCPAMYSRFDMTQYDVGLRTLRNFLVHPHGGASNRPGTEVIAEVKDSSKRVRLVPFEKGIETAYILEIGDEYARVYKSDGQVMSGESPYEIAMPYGESELWDVGCTQSADVMYLTHGDHSPRSLSRTGDAAWSISSFPWENGPFLDENTGTTTLTLAAYSSGAWATSTSYSAGAQVTSGGYAYRCLAAHTSGSTTEPGTGASWEAYWSRVAGNLSDLLTVTASASLFATADVGRWIRVRYTTQAAMLQSINYDINAEWTSSTWRVDGPFRIRYKFDSTDDSSVVRYVEYSVDGGTTWMQYDTLDNTSSYTELTGELRAEDYNDLPILMRFHVMGGTPVFKAQVYAVREERHGLLKITAYTSGTSVRVQVMKTTAFLSMATRLWSLGAWGDVPGWPKRCGFYQDRLVMGCSETDPHKIWLSRTGDYPDFGTSLPSVDDDAIAVPIVARKANAIQSIVAGKFLLALTAGGVWGVAPGSGSDTFAADSMRVESQEGWGSSEVQPVTIGDSVVYLQYYQSRARDMGYTVEKDGYKGSDLSVLSSHLFQGYQIVDMAYQEEPWSVLWMVRSDGVLLGLTYLKEHNVFAWHRHDTDGEVESVATIPGTAETELWMVVRRTIGGATKRFVERLHTREFDALEDAWFVDCGAEYDGAAATTIPVPHLTGKTVCGLADGVVFTGKTVNESGNLILDTAASHVIVGLPYTAQMETLDLNTDLRTGSTVGRCKGISSVLLRLEDSVGGEIGPDSSHLEPIVYPGTGLYSGDTNTTLASSWETAGRVFVEQGTPLPITITAMIPTVAFGG